MRENLTALFRPDLQAWAEVLTNVQATVSFQTYLWEALRSSKSTWLQQETFLNLVLGVHHFHICIAELLNLLHWNLWEERVEQSEGGETETPVQSPH